MGTTKIASGANPTLRPNVVKSPARWVTWVTQAGAPAVGMSEAAQTTFSPTTTFSPDVTSFTLTLNNTLYIYAVVAWTDASGNVQVATVQQSGSTLQVVQQPTVAATGAIGAPALAIFQGQVVIAFRQSGSALGLTWVALPTSGGTLATFPAPASVPDAPGGSAPALAVVDDLLFVAWTNPAPVPPATSPPAGAMGLIYTDSLPASVSPPTFTTPSQWYGTLSPQPVSDSVLLHPVLGGNGSTLTATLIVNGDAQSYVCAWSSDDDGEVAGGGTTPTCPLTVRWRVQGGKVGRGIASGRGPFDDDHAKAAASELEDDGEAAVEVPGAGAALGSRWQIAGAYVSPSGTVRYTNDSFSGNAGW